MIDVLPHGAFLLAILAGDAARALGLLRAHIADSQADVRQITPHRRYSRQTAA